jgi:threonine dehydratase
MNIIDFQYGKVAQDRAFPVIGIEVPQSARAELEGFLRDESIPPYKELTGTASAEFRVIPFSVELLSHPMFAVVTFANRPGALRDFMRGAGGLANVCYMNYSDSGQAVGQALMGFEFTDAEASATFSNWLIDNDIKFELIPMATIRHLAQSKNANENQTGDYSADFIRRR